MPKAILNAHQFYDYAKCKHRVYLDVYGNPTERGEESKFLKLLWERGVQHEERVIQQISAERGIQEVQGPPDESAYQLTLQLMRQGVPLIYQGVLITDEGIGRPDLLERIEGHSNFGGYCYVPIDIKSGSGYENAEDRDRVKKEYAHQILFYLELLQTVQGCNPGFGKIINIDGEVIAFSEAEFQGTYQVTKADLQQIVVKGKSYEPVLGGKCKQCPWLNRCYGWVKERNDLSLIFYLGEGKKYQFQERGIRTVHDMANIAISDYLKPPLKIHGVAQNTLKNFKRRAQVVVQGKEILHGVLNLPPKTLEVFFDIEDDPTQDIVYLYGILERRSGSQEQFIPFLARLPEDEETAFRQFIQYLENLPDCVIYHYAHHEPTVLKRLIQKYSLDEAILDRFKNKAVDLYVEVGTKTDWPLYSYGLKDIAKHLGFHWTAEDASGANSIAWYADYLKDPQKNQSTLDQIIQYNKEDCQALAYVKDYLKKMAS